MGGIIRIRRRRRGRNRRERRNGRERRWRKSRWRKINRRIGQRAAEPHRNIIIKTKIDRKRKA
jgi:hypothetical protein